MPVNYQNFSHWFLYFFQNGLIMINYAQHMSCNFFLNKKLHEKFGRNDDKVNLNSKLKNSSEYEILEYEFIFLVLFIKIKFLNMNAYF